jgi:hypothetical protein
MKTFRRKYKNGLCMPLTAKLKGQQDVLQKHSRNCTW